MRSTWLILRDLWRAIQAFRKAWTLARAARKRLPVERPVVEFQHCVMCDRQHVCATVGECWALVHAQDTPVERPIPGKGTK